MAFVVSNEQIQREAHRFARLLDAAGVGRSDAVALLLPNVPEFLYCHRGIGWSGRTCVPVNRNLASADVAYVPQNSDARELVAHVGYREAAQAAAVEDSEAGVKAAKAAGLYCAAVTTTLPAERLSAADEIAHRFDRDLIAGLLSRS